jgi:hypothetical protein
VPENQTIPQKKWMSDYQAIKKREVVPENRPTRRMKWLPKNQAIQQKVGGARKSEHPAE